jgi:hypothetical protein
MLGLRWQGFVRLLGAVFLAEDGDRLVVRPVILVEDAPAWSCCWWFLLMMAEDLVTVDGLFDDPGGSGDVSS